MSTPLKNTERFSDRVEDYVRFRPGYPAQFVECLYTVAGFSKESIIADIGSGTGIFSRLLLERGSRVIGIEPNNEMRKAAERLLAEVFPRFVSIGGTAEKTTLSDSSVDFVVCAQAFHWFDRDACRKEFARILKPGGKVVLVWNNRVVEEKGFSAEYDELLRTYTKDYKDVNHKQITDEHLKSFFKNRAYEKTVHYNEQVFNFEGLKGRLLSSSYSPKAGEENHDVMMRELRRIFDKYSQDGKISFRYDTEGYIGEVE